MPEKQNRTKEATSMRLSPEAKALLARLATSMGISQAAVVETSLRLLARREKVSLTKGDDDGEGT